MTIGKRLAAQVEELRKQMKERLKPELDKSATYLIGLASIGARDANSWTKVSEEDLFQFLPVNTTEQDKNLFRRFLNEELGKEDITLSHNSLYW